MSDYLTISSLCMVVHDIMFVVSCVCVDYFCLISRTHCHEQKTHDQFVPNLSTIPLGNIFICIKFGTTLLQAKNDSNI